MKIGKVHWLLHNLPLDFKKSYKCYFDYACHNYIFYRNKGYIVLDCFIVIRTSRKCFRVMYFNNNFKIFQYFSTRTSLETSNIMYKLYLNFDSL